MSRGRISVGAGAIEEKDTKSGHRLSVVGAGDRERKDAGSGHRLSVVSAGDNERTSRKPAVASAASVPVIAKERS